MVLMLVWMGVFGGAALDQAHNEIGALAKGIGEVSLAMFQMLETLPLSGITSVGKLDPLVPQRNFWASTEGVIAGALRAVTITVGLHFTLVLLILSSVSV